MLSPLLLESSIEIKTVMQSVSDQIVQCYEIVGIRNKRVNEQTGDIQYLVKWKGFKKPTWQPQANLSEVPDIIYDFQEGLMQAENKKAAKLPHCIKAAQKKDSKELQAQKRTNKQKSRARKLQRLGQKQFSRDNNEVQIVSSQLSAELNEIMLQESLEVIPKRKKRGQKDESSKNTRCPRTKQTQSCPVIQNIMQRPEEIRKGDVYFDQVKKVLQIKKVNDIWMVEVQFQSEILEKSWQQRDKIRLLYPRQLLDLYQQIKKQKGIKIN